MTNRQRSSIDAMPPVTFKDLDHVGTLFDTFDEYPAESRPVVPEVIYGGVVVGLAERLEALEALSELYGQRNRTRGLNQAITIKPYKDKLRLQYDSPDRVADLASKKAARQASEFDQHFEVLEAESALAEAGFGFDNSAIVAGQTRQETMDAFGEASNYKTRQGHLKKQRKTLKAIQ